MVVSHWRLCMVSGTSWVSEVVWLLVTGDYAWFQVQAGLVTNDYAWFQGLAGLVRSC